MKFLVDECCDTTLVEKLREDGHDVVYVLDILPASTDKEILHKAWSEKRILITEDKDFGELVFRFQLQSHGVILLRFPVKERHFKWPSLKKLIDLKLYDLQGKFVISEKEKTRIHDLKIED